ncbi:MAG: methyltransferase [Vulcanimicrobiota bacterium]
MRPLEHPPTSQQRALIPDLRQKLQGLGYSEEALCRLLELDELPMAKLGILPGLSWLLDRDQSSVARMAGLWFARRRLRRSEVEECLGGALVELGLELGLLEENQRGLKARVDIYPVEQALIVTDPALLPGSNQPGHVYQLGADSFSLLRLTPRRPVGRVLDLCTGSGVHAILAGFHAERVVGVDLNPRALAYSRFNAALNGLSNCEFVEGDLYQPVSGQSFDLITANPPFVATPNPTMALHRTGGPSGEMVSERLVRGLPERLADHGTFVMVLDYPIMRAGTYLERLQDWLGGQEGWGIAVLERARYSLHHYIDRHIDKNLPWPKFCAEYRAYLDSYTEQGIHQLCQGLVFIRRLQPGLPGWSILAELPLFNRQGSTRIEAWLDALVAAHDPGWPDPDWRPSLQAGVSMYTDHREGHAFLVHECGWPLMQRLEGDQARLAAALDGESSVQELGRQHGPQRTETTLRLMQSQLALA